MFFRRCVNIVRTIRSNSFSLASDIRGMRKLSRTRDEVTRGDGRNAPEGRVRSSFVSA